MFLCTLTQERAVPAIIMPAIIIPVIFDVIVFCGVGRHIFFAGMARSYLWSMLSKVCTFTTTAFRVGRSRKAPAEIV